ncbi:NAD-dependent epimerase/dehydratase family protein [Emticicia sp. BO119]|uniref:NAD-dependent epimerase/dehydratase family protein n=1 Tax=Emticicia sp. BO119 TaxID=2757768 RepID=UPI0015F0BEB1|nr:NAD-dependent epimerase/dehydratase family protein [Emticicia sp. BO119]MBA4850055.1 NAD-dependent epimerase/dehydratase family protein [Emticicia sp. BO119]
MQTILGTNGAIGIELAKALKKYTNEIRLVSRNPKKINATDTIHPADLTNKEEVFKAIKGSEIVYLTVGFEYKLSVWQKQWPELMQNVIDACIENNSKLVFFDNVYMIGGDNVKHITEESPFSPTSKKGEIRAVLDRMILNAIKERKLQAIITRAADFYGAVKDRSILMELVHKNLSEGKKAQWFFNARVKHTFTYTPDAGKATAMLGNTPEAYNQIWNLPTDHNSLTGEEWIQLFAKEMGKSGKYQLFPTFLVKLAGFFVPFLKEIYEMRYQYDREYFFDSSKFEKYFNFKPTSYQQGVKEILKAES